MDSLSRFPVIIETLGMKRRKALLELQLKEIEDAAEMFSRKTVFVAKEPTEEEQSENPTGVAIWDRARRVAHQAYRKTSSSSLR